MSALKCLVALVMLVCVSSLFGKVEIVSHGEEKEGRTVFRVTEMKLAEKEGKVFLAICDEKEKLRLQLALSPSDVKELIKGVQTCLVYRGKKVLDEKHPFYIHVAGGDAKISKLSRSECWVYSLVEASKSKGLCIKTSFCYLGVDGKKRLVVDNMQIAVRTDKMIYVILLLTDEDAKSLLKKSKKFV